MFPHTILHWLLSSRKRRRCVMIFIFIFGFTLFLLRVMLGPSDSWNTNLEEYGLRHRKVHHRATRPISNAASNYSMIDMRFKQRRTHLEQQCHVLRYYFNYSEREVKSHLVIDIRHELMYCAIEKIGSTFWKRIFQILSGYRNVSNPFQIQGLSAYQGYLTAERMPFNSTRMLLRNYTKFMFVREPFERLFSGYVDKLFSANAVFWGLGKFVVRKFRTNPSNLSLECGHDVTFEEFVRYIVHSHLTGEGREPHCYPIYQHCSPCEIDYNYIGKLETFEDDTVFLRDKFNFADKVQIDDFKSETDKDAILDAANYVFEMKANIVKCMSFLEALFRCFRKLQIRGILSKDVQYPFPFNVERNISINEFKNAMLDLHAISGPREERFKNRKEAFVEAYSSLPLSVMEKVRMSMFIDASLFGYDIFPLIIRKKETVQNTSFRYFFLPEFPKVKYENYSRN